MNLYLIRHGQTYANLNKIIQGWSDVDLTDKGKRQAAKAKNNIAGLEFERIFASDLQRTKTTAGIIFGEDADIVYDERLRELNSSVLAGEKVSVLTEKYGEEFVKAYHTLDYSYFGGESVTNLIKRAADFLDYLAAYSDENGLDDKNFVAVTHGGIIQSCMSHILGFDKLLNYGISISNGSVTLLKYSNGKWMINLINYTGSLSVDNAPFCP